MHEFGRNDRGLVHLTSIWRRRHSNLGPRMMSRWKVLIVASFAVLALHVELLHEYQSNALHQKADYRHFHQLHQALAEHQRSYMKVTKSYYFQHSYIHDGSCVIRDTSIAMFNRQHRRQQIRRGLQSNRYVCRFIQN